MQCERPKTLADGLRGRMGNLTWPIVRDFVDDVITVSEEEIIAAMQLCFERMKVWSCPRHLALSKVAGSVFVGRVEPAFHAWPDVCIRHGPCRQPKAARFCTEHCEGVRTAQCAAPSQYSSP